MGGSLTAAQSQCCMRLFTCGLQLAVEVSACDFASMQDSTVISPKCASLIKQCDATEAAVFFGRQSYVACGFLFVVCSWRSRFMPVISPQCRPAQRSVQSAPL